MSKSFIQQLIDDGDLVLWHDYRAREARDQSGNGNDGILTSTVWTGNSIDFPSSTSLITVADSAELQLTALTLVVYGDSLEFSSVSQERIISKQDAGGTNYEMRALSTGVILYDGTNSRSTSFTTNGKHYIGINATDGQIGETFADGVSVGALNGASDISVNDADLIIGNIYTGGAPFTSQAQAILIFARELTATEHAQLYGELESLIWPTKTSTVSNANIKVDPGEPGLVGGWNMRPEDGLVIDQSGNGNDGTVTVGAVHAHTVMGDALVLDGSTGYVDVGNTGQTVKTVSFLVSPDTTTEDFIDLDNGTHTIEIAAGTLTATGFSSPTLYVDGSVSSAMIADKWQRVTVTTATGFTASDLDIGKETIFLQGKIANVEIFSDEKSAVWVTAQHNRDRLALWQTDWGVNESPANVTSGFLENSPFQVDRGSFKISSDTIGGEQVKAIECVTAGIVYVPTYYFNQTEAEAAYGACEFWVNKADASNMVFMNIASAIGDANAGNNYNFLYRSDETVDYRRKTGTIIINGGATTYAAGTWHKVKIIRTNANEFEVFINEVSIGSTTDGVYTISNFMNIDIDAGDKIAYSDVVGNHSLVKRLTI